MDKQRKHYVKRNQEEQWKRLTERMVTGLYSRVLPELRKIWSTKETNTQDYSPPLDQSEFMCYMNTPHEHRWASKMTTRHVNDSTKQGIVEAIKKAPTINATGVDELFVEALQVELGLCADVICGL